MTERINRLRDRFQDLKIDAMLVSNEINVGYLSGFTGDSSWLLITEGSATIFSDGRYRTQIASECPTLKCVIRTPSQQMVEMVREGVGELPDARIGIESQHISVAMMSSLTEKCPETNWQPVESAVEGLRMIKDAREIETLRRAVDINQRAYQSVVAKFRPEWTEREIAFELEATMRFLGGQGVSFQPIVGAGPNGALPHYRPGNVAIGDYPTLLVDWGTFYGGYASDMTRTLHRPDASEKFRSAYLAVLDAQLAAIDKIRPGVAAQDVDTAARDVLKNAGLGDYFVHGLGHGVGLQIHEAPRMSAVSTENLAVGMVITVEPGVYFEGDFGIRIEDDVLVTETGHEVLSTLPKGLDDCQLIL
ncbi:M24 family metallopeptidase [Stieleria varia]|uniref:Putative peptidase n=1 Tax=Stieleria varia TaxID=2528005 RepID=A0A5C6ATS4_9BACT|nr:Xaa-Pro peptidase family protein [Stieleria varia]TWU02466.1 putative peptidase [Stieleria varia]